MFCRCFLVFEGVVRGGGQLHYFTDPGKDDIQRIDLPHPPGIFEGFIPGMGGQGVFGMVDGQYFFAFKSLATEAIYGGIRWIYFQFSLYCPFSNIAQSISGKRFPISAKWVS